MIAAARRGPKALAVNVAAALLLFMAATAMAGVFGGTAGAKLQWYSIGFGYYAVFSWATSLRYRDPPAFALIWGSRAFITTILGYGSVAFMSYAVTAFSPSYAQQVLGESAGRVGLWVGGFGAVGGFLGVIFGGRMSDALKLRNPAGRIIVVAFALTAPALFVWLAYTTAPVASSDSDFFRFVTFASLANFLASSGLGAAAATTQDLVLPRMRGTATATFFLANSLFALALGPYLAGAISHANGDNLSIGVRSIMVVVPFGLTMLAIAYRTVPRAAASVVERARAAGEPGLG